MKEAFGLNIQVNGGTTISVSTMTTPLITHNSFSDKSGFPKIYIDFYPLPVGLFFLSVTVSYFYK